MLSHINDQGNPKMVDVSDKSITKRIAHAQAKVQLTKEIIQLLKDKDILTTKGPVFQTAIIAGIIGAKKTSELIPLCHPLQCEDVSIHIELNQLLEAVIDCKTTVHHKTGVEMEALTGASIAALTIYDMCKAMSHNILIKEIRLIEKTGGKNDFRA